MTKIPNGNHVGVSSATENLRSGASETISYPLACVYVRKIGDGVYEVRAVRDLFISQPPLFISRFVERSGGENAQQGQCCEF